MVGYAELERVLHCRQELEGCCAQGGVGAAQVEERQVQERAGDILGFQLPLGHVTSLGKETTYILMDTYMVIMIS